MKTKHEQYLEWHCVVSKKWIISRICDLLFNPNYKKCNTQPTKYQNNKHGKPHNNNAKEWKTKEKLFQAQQQQRQKTKKKTKCANK